MSTKDSTHKRDPFLNFRFQAEFNGVVEVGFSEVSGLDIEIEVEKYEEGGVNDFVHQLPKRVSYSNLVLKRGMTESTNLWDWYGKCAGGSISRRSMAVVLVDYDGKTVKKRWNIKGAYPVKWQGPKFDSKNGDVAFETMEIVHQGLTKG